jgi:translation initiation factor SUI1
MNSILNIDDSFDDFNTQTENKSKVTISIQQRNGRKQITIISGLATDLDTKKILRYLKKLYHCNGAVVEDDTFGEVITLTGNQKENVYHFLINTKICNKEEIIIKGY